MATYSSVGGTPSFTSGFDPLAPLTQYLNNEKTSLKIGDLSWRGVANNSMAVSYGNEKTDRKFKTANEHYLRGGVTRASDPQPLTAEKGQKKQHN